MALSDELRDPRGLLLAGITGGLAWAAGVPVLAAAGVGAAVYGIKVAVGAALVRSGRPRSARRLPIRSNSPEDRWLRRASRALKRFEALQGSVRPGPVAEKCEAIGREAENAIEAMVRLAGQVSAVSSALSHVDGQLLRSEEERLREELKRQYSEEIRRELEKSTESIQEQLDVHGRLQQAGSALLARMESSTIGLEGLVARLAEILALTETSGGGPEGLKQIDELSLELEGLRTGLIETEDLSRKALSAFEAQDNLPSTGRRDLSPSRQTTKREGDRDVEAS
ncbi:MAG: hypothetical protein ACRD1T_01550 [Acidimicrobiia bacterium]